MVWLMFITRINLIVSLICMCSIYTPCVFMTHIKLLSLHPFSFNENPLMLSAAFHW